MRTRGTLGYRCLIPCFGILVLVACSTRATPAPQATVTVTEATPTIVQPTPDPGPFPLSIPGQYHVGMRSFMVDDPSRDNHRVPITVWYPALDAPDSTSSAPTRDADPDLKGAPYPLILSSTKVAKIFAPYLVSHGFAWASVDEIDTYFAFYEGAIDQPLDILFALDQVATNPPEGLEGLINAEMAGSIGYSFDGFNSLAMSGARIPPVLPVPMSNP